MSRERPRLSRLGVLAPAALSVCMDASVLAVPAAGAIVSTVLKELSKAFMLKKWFHGVMSSKEAENLIMEKGKNGSFLVRESAAHPGELVLSVRARGRVSHVMIRRQDNKYEVGSGELFDDLVGLIEHFRSYPMVETSGDVLRLLQPVSGGRVRSHAKQRPKDTRVKDTRINDTRIKDARLNDIQVPVCPASDPHNTYDCEFQSLKMLEDRQTFTTCEGLKLENSLKNRYRNILPYDQTRVVLRSAGDDSGYINANYVRPSRLWDSDSSTQSSNESLDSVKSLFMNSERKEPLIRVSQSLSDEALSELNVWIRQERGSGNILGYDTVQDKSYIAAQGCLPNTIKDFWRMIWQEDVRVIVMITNEVEKGKGKCVRYWPNVGHEEQQGELLVRARAETRHDDYVLREVQLSDEPGPARTVYHFQYTAWPDHDAPEDPDGVLSFLTEVNDKMRKAVLSLTQPRQNMLCVHCSAGVGRTGTFIALDMLIDNLKYGGRSRSSDVFRIVQHVRSQRAGMVQSKAQYRFIHRALRRYAQQNTRHRKIYTLDA